MARSETDPTFGEEDSTDESSTEATEGGAVSPTPGKQATPDERDTAAAPQGEHQLVVKQLDKAEHQAAFVRHQTVVEARLKQHLRIQLLRDREEAASLDPTSGRYLDFVERWATHGVNISRDAEQADRDYQAAFSRHGVAADPLKSPSAVVTASRSKRPLIVWAVLLLLISAGLLVLLYAQPWGKPLPTTATPAAPAVTDAPKAAAPAVTTPTAPKVTAEAVTPPIATVASTTAPPAKTAVASKPTPTATPEPTHAPTAAPTAKTPSQASGLYFPTPTP